jgi:NitT/TauT family transport system substrate-binding protein
MQNRRLRKSPAKLGREEAVSILNSRLTTRRDLTKGLIYAGIGGGAIAAGISPATAQTITVTHYTDGLPGAPYVFAWEENLFEKSGFKLAGIQTSGGGGTTIRNMMASDFPYGQVSLSSALEARRSGIDLTIIHSCTASVGDFSVVTMPDAPIKEPKDLIGKRIGYTNPASLTHMTMLIFLDKVGISPNQVTMQAAGGIGAQLTALRAGKLDTAIITEPFTARERGKLKEAFEIAKYIPEKIQADVGVVKPDFAKSHRKELQAIVVARHTAVEMMYKDPARAAAVINKVYKQDPRVLEEGTKRLTAIHFWDEGPLDIAAMDRSVAAMGKVGIDVGSLKGWDGIVDTSYLKS